MSAHYDRIEKSIDEAQQRNNQIESQQEIKEIKNKLFVIEKSIDELKALIQAHMDKEIY